jgi:hypothetical protein
MADRLSEPQPSPARFFWDFHKFAATEWRPGPAELPTSFSTRLVDGFIMHPDHFTSDPKGKGGREQHKNHVHVQIGDTNAEKPGAGL